MGTLVRNAWPFRKGYRKGRRRSGAKSTDKAMVKGGAVIGSGYPRNRKAGRLLKRLSEKSYFQIQKAQRCESVSGTKKWARDKVLGGCSEGFGTSLEELGSALLSGFATTDAKRAFLDSCLTRYNFLNAGNSVATLCVYPYVCRKDLDWGNTDNDVLTCFDNALAALTTAPAKESVFIGPQHAPRLRNRYKVMKPKTFVLNPGQTVNFTLRHKAQFWFSGASYRGPSTSNQLANVHGVSHGIMWSVMGSPCCDQTTETLVNYAPACVLMVGQTRLVARWCDDTMFSVATINNTQNPVGTVTNAMLVNDDSGGVMSYASA